VLSDGIILTTPPIAQQNKYRKGYTENDLQEAVNMVKHGSSFRAACSTNKISKTTLMDRDEWWGPGQAFCPDP
jgi:hypothetical protein